MIKEKHTFRTIGIIKSHNINVMTTDEQSFDGYFCTTNPITLLPEFDFQTIQSARVRNSFLNGKM
jgi:hypothetical protein